MPLPYSYRHKIELTEDSLFGRFPDALADMYRANGDRILESQPGRLLIESKNNLFRQAFEFEIQYQRNNNGADIIYEIKLEALMRMSIFIVMASAFFLFLSVSEFLIYGSILTVVFFLINLLFLTAYVSRPIERYTGSSNYDDSQLREFSKLQKQWEKDPYKCTACGTDLTDLDIFCPECGIRIKKGSHEIPVSFSKYQNMSFRYEYKEKKKPPEQ
jgi:hypothetical protein